MQYPADAGRGEDLQGIGQRDIALAVAFALQSQHGVGADGDAAVDHAGQVDAEERHRRIGDRIDQMVDDLVVLRRQLEILAAERTDDKPGIDAEHFYQPIGHQARTGDQRRGLIFSALAGADHHAAGMFFQGADFGVVDDRSAFRFEVLRHCRRHFAVADDAAGRDEDPAEPGNVRFALA